jgi:hypothetical protein
VLTILQNPIPRKTVHNGIAVDKGVIVPTSIPPPSTPKIIPNILPRFPSTTASIKNCHKTSIRRAPTAFQIPISRVRSVTETNMIFTIPMPPKARKIAAIKITPNFTPRDVSLNVSINDSWSQSQNHFVYQVVLSSLSVKFQSPVR